MIISASRRTDIPAFYSEWFMNRLREGSVLVRNPFNSRQVRRVSLSPASVDCIVFWTKNPENMISKLERLDDYGTPYYFLFTITPYDQEIEKNIPSKDRVIELFLQLAERIGKERVIWRYDPVFLAKNIDVSYHLRYFEYIAQRLKGYTEKCIISFLVLYRKCMRNLRNVDLVELRLEDKLTIARNLCLIAHDYDLHIQSCAEDVDLSCAEIMNGKCIDDGLISRISGKKIGSKKDRSQRNSCRCVESIDIGAYNSCLHNCLYCYANENITAARANNARHDPHSALLLSDLDTCPCNCFE